MLGMKEQQHVARSISRAVHGLSVCTRAPTRAAAAAAAAQLSSSDFNDVWLLDMSQDDPRWDEMAPASSVVPSARSGHSAVCTDHGNLCVYGGFANNQKGASKFLSDTFEFDARTCTWHALRIAARSGTLPKGTTLEPFNSTRWGPIRFRLALHTCAPCGPSVRVVSLTKSRKIPTRKTRLPLFLV